MAIPLGHGHDEQQVRLDHPLPGARVAPFDAAGELALLRGAQAAVVRAARRRNSPERRRGPPTSRSPQASGALATGLATRMDPGGERDRRGLGARPNAELLEDVREMELHRVLAEVELGGDLTVAMADGHQPQDVELAVAERPDERARRLVDTDGSSRRAGAGDARTCVPQPATDSIWSDPPRTSARRRIARRPPRAARCGRSRGRRRRPRSAARRPSTDQVTSCAGGLRVLHDVQHGRAGDPGRSVEHDVRRRPAAAAQRGCTRAGSRTRRQARRSRTPPMRRPPRAFAPAARAAAARAGRRARAMPRSRPCEPAWRCRPPRRRGGDRGWSAAGPRSGPSARP